MKRNLFSYIFPANILKIILILFFIFNTNHSLAIIRVEPDNDLVKISDKEHWIYVYYNKEKGGISYLRSQGETNLPIPMNDEDNESTTKYLAALKNEATDLFSFPYKENGVSVDEQPLYAYIKESLTIRPDKAITLLQRSNISEPSEEELILINEIKNDKEYENLIKTIDYITNLYPLSYDALFNTVANYNTLDGEKSLFRVKNDFYDGVATPLGYFLLKKYMNDFNSYLTTIPQTESVKIIKSRVSEILLYINQSGYSSGGNNGVYTLDAVGVNFSPSIWDAVKSLGHPVAIGISQVSGDNVTFTLKYPTIDYKVGIPDPPTKSEDLQGKVTDTCGTTLMEVISAPSTNCSVVAFLINLTLVGIGKVFGYLLILAGDLFNWSMNFSIVHFNDWVTNSQAYDIWRDVVLALITSLLLPLVFYLIIRMLIDNDAENIKKLLPRILITAIFVYFSFYIAGWLIDRANEISIYMYRSLHGSEPFGDSIIKVLGVDTGSLGSAAAQWDATLFLITKVIVVGVGIFVILQGGILIFVRSIVLILALIFSPLMLLPIGLNKYIDKYRDMVINNFTNSAIMAPIFMLLLLVAMKIGEKASDFIKLNSSLNSISSAAIPENVSNGFIGATISSVFVIIVLQIAITVAKQMSGEIGQAISGKISSLSGNAVFGGAAMGLRTATKWGTNTEKFQGWMKKNEGTNRGRIMSTLVNKTQNSTMDVRNTKGFEKLTGGINGEKNVFGTGSQRTIKSKFEKDYAEARKYHNSLSEEGKKRNLKRLRGAFGGINGEEIANRLEGKNSGLTLKERVNAEGAFNSKLDKANKEKNEIKRKDSILKILDEHFSDNGKGENYLSKELEKPENKELKEKIDNINKTQKDENERKKEILNTVAEFEEKKNKAEEISNNKNKRNNNTNTSANQSQNTNPRIAQYYKQRENILKKEEYKKEKIANTKEGERRSQQIKEQKELGKNIATISKEVTSLNKNFSEFNTALKNSKISLVQKARSSNNSSTNSKISNSYPAPDKSKTDDKNNARVGKSYSRENSKNDESQTNKDLGDTDNDDYTTQAA